MDGLGWMSWDGWAGMDELGWMSWDGRLRQDRCHFNETLLKLQQTIEGGLPEVFVTVVRNGQLERR